MGETATPPGQQMLVSTYLEDILAPPTSEQLSWYLETPHRQGLASSMTQGKNIIHILLCIDQHYSLVKPVEYLMETTT